MAARYYAAMLAWSRGGKEHALTAAVLGQDATEAVRPRRLDPDLDHRPDERRRPRKVDQLVLPRPPRKPDEPRQGAPPRTDRAPRASARPARRLRRRRPLASSWSCARGCAIESIRTDATDAEPLLVPLEPDPLLDRQEPIEARPLQRRRHVVGKLRRRRPRPDAVRRREDLVVADPPEERQGLLVLLVRSPRRTRRSRPSRSRSRGPPRGSAPAAPRSGRSNTGAPSA